MDRDLLHGNRIVSERALRLNREFFIQSILKPVPGVTIQAPYPVLNPQNRASKFFQQQGKSPLISPERISQIEKQNQQLLSKIMQINKPLKSPIKLSPLNTTRHRNLSHMTQIQDQNRALLRRLQQAKSHYNLEQWKADRWQTEQRIKQISLYKSESPKPKPSSDYSDRSIVKDTDNKPKRQKCISIGYNEFGADGQRKLLYRGLHSVSNEEYTVEISRTKHKVFVILFKKGVMIGDQFPIKLMHKWLEATHSYEDVIAQFSVKFGKLVRGSEEVQMLKRARQLRVECVDRMGETAKTDFARVPGNI